MTAKAKASARLVGLLLGCALAAALVASWRVPASGGAVGASLTMVRGGTGGDLEVSPDGPFLVARRLEPAAADHAAEGSLSTRNLTPRALGVRILASPSRSDLDDLVRIEVRAGRELVFRGPVGALRRGEARPFVLRPRAVRALRVRAWLPPSVTQGYQGRAAVVRLRWRTRAVGG